MSEDARETQRPQARPLQLPRTLPNTEDGVWQEHAVHEREEEQEGHAQVSGACVSRSSTPHRYCYNATG